MIRAGAKEYYLDPVITADGEEIQLKLVVLESCRESSFSTKVERLSLVELKPFGSCEVMHSEIWMQDDHFNALVADIRASGEEQLLQAAISKIEEFLGRQKGKEEMGRNA